MGEGANEEGKQGDAVDEVEEGRLCRIYRRSQGKVEEASGSSIWVGQSLGRAMLEL